MKYSPIDPINRQNVASLQTAWTWRTGEKARPDLNVGPDAIDKATGRDLWSAPTAETTGTPMTYLTSSGRQFVVVATGRGADAALVAFALDAPSTVVSGLAGPVIGPACSESGFPRRVGLDVDLTPR